MRSNNPTELLAPSNPNQLLKQASLTFLECTQLNLTKPQIQQQASSEVPSSSVSQPNNPQDSQGEEDNDEDRDFTGSEDELFHHPKNYSYYFDDSDDSEFEYVPHDSEDLNSVGSQSDNEDESLYEDDTETTPKYRTPPFWYNAEEPEHIEAIIRAYQENLIKSNEYSKRSHQPFVACVQRANASTGDVFQTYDVVIICNNQRMPDPMSPMPVIEEIHLLTTWNDDGIPSKFFRLGTDQINFWEQKLQYIEPSYLRCAPDYFGQNTDITKSLFTFSCSSDYSDIHYSNLPWNNAPFNAFVKHRVFSFEKEFPTAIRCVD